MGETDVLRTLLRRWWVVLLCVAIGFAVAYVRLDGATKVYQSTGQVVLTTASTTANYLETRGATYASVASQGQFQDRVQTALGVDPGDPYPGVSVALVTGSALLEVTAQDDSPEGAQQAAQTASDELITLVASLDGGPAEPVVTPEGETPEATPAPVLARQATAPALETNQVAPTPSTDLGFGILFGLIIGIAAALALGRADRRLTTGADLVHESTSAVLAELPRPARGGRTALAPEWRSGLTSAWGQLVGRGGDFASGARSLCVAGPSDTTSAVEVALNLAALSQEAGRRTLVVLATGVDSGRVPAGGGRSFSTSLSHGSALPDVQRVSEGFDRLVVGPEDLSTATPLLVGDALPALLARVLADYAVVILVPPAVLPRPEGTLFARAADATVLVAALGETQAGEVRAAESALQRAGALVSGIVVAPGTARRLRGPWSSGPSRPEPVSAPAAVSRSSKAS